jgi:ABC-type antimicrobial peptide transport system permease subunit
MISVLIPGILFVSALWVAFMGYINVRSRQEEIGILRSVGVSSGTIFKLFTLKHIFIGILGGFSGLAIAIIPTAAFTSSFPSIQKGLLAS